jgi:hypothetical protein
MQRVLEEHPRMLAQALPGEQQAWILPQLRLGSEYVADFFIAQRASEGYVWYAVELERPQEKMSTSNGDLSQILHHALGQILDWREWLKHNLDYAARPTEQSGLGLPDIEPDPEGLIIIGRDSEALPSKAARRRRSLCRNNRVRIETYDWLLSAAQKHLESIGRAQGRLRCHGCPHTTA